MKLIILAALAALCSGASLDRTYLPPASAKTAGGAEGSLQTPLQRDGLPVGSFVNDAQGVVVDAAAAGTRASPGAEESGLGGERPSYGSTASKVGDAAFKESVLVPNTFARIAPIPEHETIVGPVYGDQVFKSKTLLPSKDYNSNTLSYQNNVESHKYNYGFETDNGIVAGEQGVAHDGSHAHGGFSYKGSDGQDYKVTYTADKDGYRPQGSHLPTPPPIPDDIVKSIEQNAKEEAAGHYDDGSYDAQKHNAEGDYGDSNKHDDEQSQFGRPGSQVGAFNINQSSQSAVQPTFGSTFSSHGSSHTVQAFPTSSTGAQGTFGSSNFGQHTHGTHTNKASSPCGITTFGAQRSSTVSCSPSASTQFGSQNEQQSVLDYGNKPAFPTHGSSFGKPSTTTFGSSSTFGQVGSSIVADKDYSPSTGNEQAQVVNYQAEQFGVGSTSSFSGGVKQTGFGLQSTQGSSATASAAVSGSQSSVSGLSPQVLSALQRPSGAQSGQYTPQGDSTRFGVQKDKIQSSTYSQSQTFGSASGNKQPQPAGFLAGFETLDGGHHSHGDDLSYHYNQPAKPFNSPSSSSQGTVSSGQQLSQTGYQTSSFNTQFNKPSQTFGSATPTASSGSSQTSYNGITQAAVSPFPSPSPTPVSSLSQKEKPQQQPFSQGSQFGLKPSTQNQQNSFGQTSLGSVDSQKPTSTFQNAPSVPSQQYSGELYEYNKPEQGIPAQSGTPSSAPSSAFGKPASSSSQSSLSTQFGQGTLESKPVSKPQFGFTQSSQTGSSFGKFQGSQSTQLNTQNIQSQSSFGTQSYKPFGSQFGSQGAKPQSGQTSQGSFTQTQTQQSVIKPSQFGVSAIKPQFGSSLSQFSQGSQFSQESGVQQSTQTTQQTVGSVTQQTQSSQSLLDSQSKKPFSTASQFGTQGNKPQFGQASLTQQAVTQQGAFQQTVGSGLQQGSQSQFGSYKPFGSSQFGTQGIKPQLSQVSQGSFTQTQTQQSVKPFGSSSQFGVSETKPQFGSQTSQSSFQQTTQGNKLIGVSLAPISITSTLGVQASKPQSSQGSQLSQGSSVQQSTQSTQQTVGSVTQQAQGSQTQVDSQSNKPLSPSSQTGTQANKLQFGQASQSQQGAFQQTQQNVGVVTQQGSYKPFGSSQFGSQGTKPQLTQVSQTSQGSSFTQTQTTQQTSGSVASTQQQTKPQSVYLPSKPLYQGSQFQQSTQQTVGSLGLAGGQPSKPFSTTTQFGTQGSKPESNSFTQSQTIQNTDNTLIQQTGSEAGSNPVKGGAQGSLTQTQTIQQTVGSVSGTKQPASQSQFGTQPLKPLGTQGSKPQFGQTQTTQQSSFIQSQFNQQSSYNKFGQSKPFTSSSPAPFSSAFGTQPIKTQFGSNSKIPQTSSGTQFGSQFSQSSKGSSQFGLQPLKPFPTSHHQETKPQFGAPAKPAFGQSSTTFAPVTNNENSQSQLGYQYKQPQFGSAFTGFGSSQTSSSATSFQQPFKGAQFGGQPFRPFGTQFQPAKSQFGQTPTSSASAFASSSSTPVPVSQFSVQPYGALSTVFPTAQSTTLGQEVSGSSLGPVQGSEFGGNNPFGSGVSYSTPQPLGSTPNYGFSKPCCKATIFGQNPTTASSFGISSTTPSYPSTPQGSLVQGSTSKPEEFSGPKQPQRFDEKTGYYY